MNLVLPTGPLAQAIGWALLHLIWQGALVAALLAVALSLLSKRSANLRYALSCAALVAIVGLGVGTAIRSLPEATTVVPTPRTPAGGDTARHIVAAALATAQPDRLRAIERAANDALPLIVTIWLAGVAFLSARLLLAWLDARRLVARSGVRAREPWQTVARRLGLALGVRHAVRLLESAAVEVPSVIGFLRPAILLPASTLTGLTPAQLEMILAHELAHVRRHDFLVNLLQAVVETLLFYHPAVWWISRQVRVERENCCDDLAVAVCGNPVHYARALARLEELRSPGLSIALSATGGSLVQRIRRLVGASTRSAGPAARGAAAAAVLSCLLVAVAAQSFTSAARRGPSVEREHQVSAAWPASVDRAEPRAVAVGERPKPEPEEAPATDEQPQQELEAAPDAAPDGPATSIEDDPQADDTPEPDAVQSDDDRPSLDDLIALRAQHVTPEFVREMRTLFPGIKLMEIASMSAVGATPDFVRDMRHAGLDVSSAGDAQSLAALGVTREYVRAMRSAGFSISSAEEASGLKAVGVTPAYVREMREAGVPLNEPGQAQSLCAVGVTPDYVRAMRAAGVQIDDVGELQSLRALGITPEFVRRLARAGYRNLTVSQLNRLGAAGVTGDFIREMSRYRTP